MIADNILNVFVGVTTLSEYVGCATLKSEISDFVKGRGPGLSKVPVVVINYNLLDGYEIPKESFYQCFAMSLRFSNSYYDDDYRIIYSYNQIRMVTHKKFFRINSIRLIYSIPCEVSLNVYNLYKDQE